MTITVQWDNPEHTIVRWDFDGEWDWKMYGEAQKQSNSLIQSVEHRVGIIGDVRRSPKLPTNALAAYNNSQRNTLDNSGLIVLVGASGFVRRMVTMFSKLYRISGLGFAFADTLEDARSMFEY